MDAIETARRTIVVVGFSGGVTSAWCAGWALRNYPRESVVLLWHDTKEEDSDTYRFLRAMAEKLGMPITERSDGRSVTEVFRDEGFLGNNQQTPCARILKMIPGQKYVGELQAQGFDVVRVFGYSAHETLRVNRQLGHALHDNFTPRFPVIEEGVTKQDCADWCTAQGVCPSSIYEWSAHANCVGCVKGGKAYWLAVHKHAPEVYEQRAALEEEFGHTILRGGDREHPTLRELAQIGKLKRRVTSRESIDLGSCPCGD